MVHARGLRRGAIHLATLALVVAGCASAGGPPGDSSSGCTAGAACATGNPGDCAAGHVVCSDGKKSCEPDVTEQPCYSGEPETTHRGTCHPGTQSCIGKLGVCMGAVLPAPESCFNQLDEDCDGHVNNGCPMAVTIGLPDLLIARGGSGGGVAASLCPTGSLVTGLDVQLSANNVNPGYVISVQPTCATPTLMHDATAFSVALTPIAGPAAMSASDAARAGVSHILCGGSGLAVASGAQGSITTSGRTVVESAGLDCSNITVALDADNRLQLGFVPDTVHSGVASVQVSGAVWNDACGAGEVLVGFQGRTGSQMDQIQGLCAPLSVKYN
jgi:hypothetical protein